MRVRNDALAVGGEVASLHGARLEDDVRRDGTPILRVPPQPDALRRLRVQQ